MLGLGFFFTASGAGACGGQFTANTMALCLTALGLSPMGVNDVPAFVKEVGFESPGARKDMVTFSRGGPLTFTESPSSS